MRNGRVVGFLRFEDAVQEIFDLQILRGIRFPEILEPDSEFLATSFVLPDAALKETALPSPSEIRMEVAELVIRDDL